MAELIPTFYETDTLFTKDALLPGAIFEAPILYIDSKLNILKIQYVDPQHKNPPMLRINEVDEQSFNHPPVIELGLQNNEEIAALKCKRRPVIIFSRPVERWRQTPGKEQQIDTCFCLPMFSLEDYDREFVASLRAFKYENAFYLPENKIFGIKESFIRFDRGQIIHCHHLKRWHPTTKLHEDAQLLLQEWFRYFTTGVAEDWVLQYQKDEVEKLKGIVS
jgi:hypothetical protein